MTTEDTMTARLTGVYSRSRSKLWQYRVKVPKDLSAAYASEWADRCSLGTSDLREANLKAAQLHSQWLAKFAEQRLELAAQHRASNPQKVERITPEMAQAMADTLMRDVLAVDERLRTNPGSWSLDRGIAARLKGMPEHLVDSLQEVNLQQQAEYSSAIARGNVGRALPAMRDAAAKLGISFENDTPGLIEALQGCLEALRQAYTIGVRRDEGEAIATPPAPLAQPAEQAAKKTDYLRDVFDRWKESGDKPRSRDSIAAYDRALRQFEAQYPQVQLRDISRDMGDSYRTLLRTTSKTSKTASDKFTAIKSLLKYAAETLQWLDLQPWRGLKIQYTTTNKRRPWTQAELETLFAAPLHQAYALPKDKNAGADAAYWVPLLALYSGARAGELCQLRPGDVGSVDGILALVITDDGEGQKVKTAAGHRTIPIHSELVRLGFLEYADAQQKRGAASLWPALPLRADKPSDYFGRWFLKHRMAVGLPGAGGPTMHYFRHTVRPLMRRAGFDRPTQDKITGHETKGSIGDVVYDHWLLEELRPAVEAIKYPYLNLPRVYPVAKV
jgi:integrase